MAQKKTYNIGDVVGRNAIGDKSIGIVETDKDKDQDGNTLYGVYFYTEPTGQVGLTADELISKPGHSYKKTANNMNVPPGGGSRKSRRRSRKNKRTRRVRQ